MTLWHDWRTAFRLRAKPQAGTLRAYEGTRLEEIASLETLAEAWSRVRANKGGPGGDGVTLADLDADIDPALERLSKALLNGSYRPSKLRQAFMAKGDGERRGLRIPAVIDRVAQTSALVALQPAIDRRISDASCGYRPRRGVADAIRAVEDAYVAGLVWTVDADIERCFDMVRHRQLLIDLAIWIEDERILRLIARWLRSFSWYGRGLAQGAPISPFLANIYLHPIDRLMAARGYRMVRYADDFLILARSRSEAKRAFSDVGRLLSGRGLSLSRRKSRIVAPGQELTFLGCTLRSPPANRSSLWPPRLPSSARRAKSA